MTELESRLSEPTGGGKEDSVKFTLEEAPQSAISIKVVGLGGCGGNIVDFMMDTGVEHVEFACVNTDEQALQRCRAPMKLRIGQRVTQGYGTGSNPDVGREAALENTEELTELMGQADMVFLALGLGGGTGTGAGPVIASLAKQMGALTIAAAVKPFVFEGKRRSQTAEAGLAALLEQVDTVIIIPNESLLGEIEPGSGFFDGFRVANKIAMQTLEGITDLITKTGIMNSDFADVRAVFQDAGIAVVGSAQCAGREAALQAAREAIGSPVMEHEGLSRASKVLVNITGSGQFGMHDASDALQLIQREIGREADLTVGVVRDESMGEDVRVMLIASGFEQEAFRPPPKRKETTEAHFQRERSWKSETAGGLLGSDHGLPQSSSVVQPRPAPQARPLAAVPPQEEVHAQVVEAPEPEAEMPERVPVEAEPLDRQVGSPYDFVPSPTVRAEDDADESQTMTRPSFFRRRSFFG